MRYFIIWLVINFVTAYDWTCPHRGQWELRARAEKCSNIENYVCLFDAVQLKFDDKCIGPHEERKGTKPVLNIGNFNRKSCSPTHYQPLKFFSFGNTNCTHLKSPCSEEGQVIADNGTSVSDRSCRCDYLQGYAFVVNTSLPCSCIPSKEDCTCYLKTCMAHEVLSPDYVCVNEANSQGVYKCSTISRTESYKPVTDVVTLNESVPIVKRYIAVGCIILVIIIVFLLLSLCYWEDIKELICYYCFDEVIIVKGLEDQNCFEGSSVTFTCEINKENIPGQWKKDREDIEFDETLFSITVDDKIHKLLIHSPTAKDGGIYSCHFSKDKYSSSKLIVIEVTIIKGFEDQHCIEGQTVTFECEVDQNNVPVEWSKDGMDLKLSKSDKLTADGKNHKLVIHRCSITNKGYYKFEVGLKSCGGHLLIEDVKYILLCHLLKTVAVPVVRKIFDSEIHPNNLKKILNIQQNKKIIDDLKKKKYINWPEYHLLYPRVVEYSVKFKILEHDYKKIQNNEEEKKKFRVEIGEVVSSLYLSTSVEGTYKVEVSDFESGSLVVVLKLTASNFTTESVIEKTIKSAVGGGKLGHFKTNSTGFVFKKLKNVPVTITSKHFDIRLMMILMKKLIDFNIADKLPYETDITQIADLSRIKYIRNKIVQNSEKSISNEDFEEDWNHLSMALKRLGGETVFEDCETLKNHKPTPQEIRDYLNPDNLQSDQRSTSNDSLSEEFFQETNMHNLARDVVRRKFDKQFPPQYLEKEIEERREHLTKMKEERGITQSQWNDLYPEDKGNLSSTRFDMKVMIILLSNSPFKNEEIFKTIENLQNYLSRPKEEKKAIMQAIKEISEGE